MVFDQKYQKYKNIKKNYIQVINYILHLKLNMIQIITVTIKLKKLN